MWFAFNCQVLCIIMSLLYTVYIIHRSIGRWKDLYEKSRTNGSDPILYIRIIESSAYINFALSVIYTQTFKGYTVLKYLNLLERYTRKHQIIKYKLVSPSWAPIFTDKTEAKSLIITKTDFWFFFLTDIFTISYCCHCSNNYDRHAQQYDLY